MEFVLAAAAFEIRITDGPTVRVPYEVARYASVDGPRKAFIYTQGGAIWVEAQGAVMPVELDRQLALRKPLAPVVAEQLPWGEGEPPPVITRQYAGQKTGAAAAMGRDATFLSRYGYVPVSQTYAEGSWGCGAWFLAFLALFFLVGIIILVYMAVNRPDGNLTVVYERRVPASPAAQAVTTPPIPDRATPAPSSSVRDRLGELDGLRADGLITDEEYAAQRGVILESL